MAYDTTIILQSPTRLSHERVEREVLAIPGVRAVNAGRFLYEDAEAPREIQVEIRTDQAEDAGRILLAFDRSGGEPTALAVHHIALSLAQALPLEQAMTDDWQPEQSSRSWSAQPTGEMRDAPAISGRVSLGIVPSRTELQPSRMGEVNTTRGVSVAVQLLFISIFLFVLYLGPRPLREIVIALGVLFEVAIAIWSATRRRRYPRGS